MTPETSFAIAHLAILCQISLTDLSLQSYNVQQQQAPVISKGWPMYQNVIA